MLPNPLDLLRRLNLSHNYSPYIELILLEERERLIEREERLRGFIEPKQTEQTTPVKIAQRPKKEYKTHTLYIEDFKNSSGEHNILMVNKEGKLIEIMLVSDSNDYSVVVETDTFRLDKTYDELSQISDYVDSINAYQDGSNYILSMYNIKFTKFEFSIIFNSEITFSNIYAKWEELE